MNWRAIRKRVYNSRQYRRNRKLILATDPLCRPCYDKGRIRPATQMHHVEPIKSMIERGVPIGECSGLGDIVPICEDCHEEATALERKASKRARYYRFDERGRRVA